VSAIVDSSSAADRNEFQVSAPAASFQAAGLSGVIATL
jgi:hypothetical protein